jgi:uncharacterized membrane protein YfcA
MWESLTISAFFITATFYASVGHGGASSYLALMVWLGWPMEQIRPQALTLNLVVSLAGTLLFLKAGTFRGKVFIPLVLVSIPMAWFGGSMRLSNNLYEGLLALGLLAAAMRLLFQPGTREISEPRLEWLLIVGGLIGWMSGMIGIGGGIFLTPVLIIAGWTSPKEAAALSAPFIFVNSAAGLLGHAQADYAWDGFHWELIPAVALGGLIGAWWGSHRASPPQVRYALSLVLLVASSKLVFSIT